MTDFRSPHPFLVAGVYLPLSVLLVGTFAPSSVGPELTAVLVAGLLFVLAISSSVVGSLMHSTNSNDASEG